MDKKALTKFREKYPQYDKVDDMTIATKLAEKFPDAYGDLPKQVSSFLPKKSVVEKQISQRPDSVATLMKELSTPMSGNPLSAAFKPLTTAVKAISVPFQRGEAAIASGALSAQAGESPLQQAGAVLKGVSGQRNAQLGDVIRTTGFGGKLNEPLSSATGLLALMGAGNLLAKGKVAPSLAGKNAKQIATQSMNEVKGALKTTGDALKNFPKLFNLGGRKTAQEIANKADKGFNTISKTLSDKYDDVLGGIKGKVKATEVMDDIASTIDEFPEAANVGKLKAILKRISKQDELSAQELFNIKKEISKTISPSVWNGVSEMDSLSYSKEQLYWKITERLEKVGGEKFTGLTNEYKTFKHSERLARKMFYRQGVPSNYPVGKGIYDIPTQEAVRGLSSQLPKEQQFAQQFEAWRRGQKVKKAALLPLGYLAARKIGLLGNNRSGDFGE